MLVKTVFPVEELAGTIGMGASPAEATFYKRNGLQCARQYIIPTPSNTDIQQLQRNIMITAAQYFSVTLDAAQRLAWGVYSAENPRLIKGQLTDIGALAMFASFAMTRLALGLAIVEDPPSGVAPTPDPNTYALTSLTISDDAPNAFAAVVTGNPASLAGMYVTVEYTAPLPGAQMPRDTDYRYIRVAATNMVYKQITTTAAATNYAYAHLVGTVGQRIGYRVRLWIATDNSARSEWVGVAIVTTP